MSYGKISATESFPQSYSVFFRWSTIPKQDTIFVYLSNYRMLNSRNCTQNVVNIFSFICRLLNPNSSVPPSIISGTDNRRPCKKISVGVLNWNSRD